MPYLLFYRGNGFRMVLLTILVERVSTSSSPNITCQVTSTPKVSPLFSGIFANPYENNKAETLSLTQV